MTMPTSRVQRSRALGEALRHARSLGPVPLAPTLGLLAGFLAAYVADALLLDTIGTPGRQVIAAAVFAVVAAPVWLSIQRGEVRDAIEVMTWLNGWEAERWQREIGRRLSALPRAQPDLVDSLPDTMGLRPLRIELLAARGETAEAWERMGHLPVDTPWQRFERAALAEWTLWWTDGPEQVADMEAELPDLAEDPERHLVARTMVAAAQARRAAVAGGAVVPILAPLRAELGDRPRRYALPYRTGVLMSVALTALIASVAVTIAATIIR